MRRAWVNVGSAASTFLCLTAMLATGERSASAQAVPPAPSGHEEPSTEDDLAVPSSADSKESTVRRSPPSPPDEGHPSPSRRAAMPPDQENEEASPSTDAKRAKTLSTTTGLAVAIQLAYSAPAGELSADAGFPFANYFGGQLAFLGELGGRVTPAIFIGAYGGYARGSLGSGQGCDARDCAGYSARVGAAVRYRFFLAPGIQPWIGYAAGYEIAGASIGSAPQQTTATLTGFEFAHLSAGLDYSNDRLFAIGPVVDVALGQYNHVTGEARSVTTDRDITQAAVHAWVSVGVRCTLME